MAAPISATPSTGSTHASTATMEAEAVSAVVTTELPIPPVAAEAAPRMAAMPPWMMPAAPPPAMAARPHLSMGSMCPMKPAARMVPAMMAAGAPSTSSVWSMTGM